MNYRLVFACLALLSTNSAYAHCGGAFCVMNTNWDVQGVWDRPGIRFDLRAEFIDLDQLRHGSDKTSPAGVLDTHDETRTINRNYAATIDWSIDQDWGLTFRVPVVDRSHNHVHNLDDGSGNVEPEKESWDFTKLGDLQAVARYSFYQDGKTTAGVRFGLKLPTGSKEEKNDAGEKAERSLQPGTGSTDAILGLYYNLKMGKLTWFAQGSWQQVIHEQDHFRPGQQAALDLGLNYSASADWNLMLQLNTLYKGHDAGRNAESDDSGGTYVYLSPGVSYRVTPETQIYGFLQQPLHQHVRGTQLTADWAAAFGISTQF